MQGEIVKGTLQCGFEYEVDMVRTRSMRFVDALAEASGENGLAFSTAFKILLGAEQREKLYKYLEDKGITPDVECIANIMGEIMQSTSDLKK